MSLNFHPLPLGTVVASAARIDNPARDEFAQAGWLVCEGQAVSRVAYADLFALLGTAHGHGDGHTTFALPDLRGRFLRGVDGGTGRDPDAASRRPAAAGGHSGDAVGTLQDDALRQHTHGVTEMIFNDDIDGLDSTTTRHGEHHNESRQTGITGGCETRPLNVAMHWLILAGPPASPEPPAT